MNANSSHHDAPGAPLVSVCIPTYNRARKLQRHVARLLECDYRNIEVVISDNGSTDDTVAVGESLAKSDNRVSYHRHDRNMGIIANFAFVRNRAQGKYFMWHADDDYLDENYISSCVRALEAEPPLMLAYGLAAFHGGDGEIVSYGRRIDLASKSPTLRILKYLWEVTENSMLCGLYRTDAVKDCIFPGILGGDWTWIAQVISLGRIERIPGILVYRERGSSASSSPEGLSRLVQLIGLPGWQAAHPRYAIAAGIATCILDNPTRFSKRTRFRSLPLALMVFIVLLIKGTLPTCVRWARRIPGLQLLRR